MPSDAQTHQPQDSFHPAIAGQEEGCQDRREPHDRDRDDLGSQGNGPVFHEASDMRAEIAVTHHPTVQPLRATDIEPAGQEPERGGGKQREKYPDRSQHQENRS